MEVYTVDFNAAVKEIDQRISELEERSRKESDVDKKVELMKQITKLKSERLPLHYKSLTEEDKYKCIEGIYVTHMKMASSQNISQKEVEASFYEKAYTLDPQCNRFFADINKNLNSNLVSQPHAQSEPNPLPQEPKREEDLFWETIEKKRGGVTSIDIGYWIGQGFIYGFLLLAVFIQAILVYREGMKGFGLLAFFLIFAAPVYGYGVWADRKKEAHYQEFARKFGFDFSKGKGKLPFFLYAPFVHGSYENHQFTLRMVQNRPQGYHTRNMITESVLGVEIPKTRLTEPLSINLNLLKTDDKWKTRKHLADGLIGSDLVEEILSSLEEGKIKWGIVIDQNKVIYKENGALSNDRMVESFCNAVDLLAKIAHVMKTGKSRT